MNIPSMPDYHPPNLGGLIIGIKWGIAPAPDDLRTRSVTVILLARQRLPACYLSAAGRRWLGRGLGPTGAAGVSALPQEGL